MDSSLDDTAGRARTGLLDGRLPRWLRPSRHTAGPVLRVRGRNASWLLPATLLAGIAIADRVTPAEFIVTAWVVLVPAFAAVVCGLLATTCFAVASVAFYLLSDTPWTQPHPQGPGVLVVAAAVLSVLACWLRLRALSHLLSIERAAEATRLAVLRPVPQLTGGLESASVYLSADVAARVGGDFYDLQPSRHGPRVLLGDVQGKGTTAVDAAAALLGTFRECAYHEPQLATVAEHLEIRMSCQNERDVLLGHEEGRFATAVLIGFPAEPDEEWLELVNFGHAGPLAVGPAGVRTLPEGQGRPLGLARLPGLPDATPPMTRVPFDPQETLVLYTDGVTEARDRAGAFFPLADLMRAATDTGPESLVALIRRELIAHTRGRLADDTAILAVRRAAGPSPR